MDCAQVIENQQNLLEFFAKQVSIEETEKHPLVQAQSDMMMKMSTRTTTSMAVGKNLEKSQKLATQTKNNQQNQKANATAPKQNKWEISRQKNPVVKLAIRRGESSLDESKTDIFRKFDELGFGDEDEENSGDDNDY